MADSRSQRQRIHRLLARAPLSILLVAATVMLVCLAAVSPNAHAAGRARPAVAVVPPSGRVADDITAAMALHLATVGFEVVGTKARANITVFAATSPDGGASVVVTEGSTRKEIVVAKGAFNVVRLEAEAQTLAAVLAASVNVEQGPPLSPAVFLSVDDVREGPDLGRVTRAAALRLLSSGYTLVGSRQKRAVRVCVDLREDDVAVGAAPPGVATCSAAKRIDRGTAEGGREWVNTVAIGAQNRADLALAGPDKFDLGQSDTTVPYGNRPRPDRQMLGDDGDDEGFIDSFAPRRAFVSGAIGLLSRGRDIDPSARVLFRTEHSRNLGLGVLVDVNSGTDTNLFATELMGLIGLTYAVDLEFGFSAQLGAFGGGRLHIYSFQNPLLVPDADQERDGVVPELIVAAMMSLQYKITPTFSVVGSILFSFGEERSYGTAQLPLWTRAAGGISPAIGLAWQLPILEGAKAPTAVEDMR